MPFSRYCMQIAASPLCNKSLSIPHQYLILLRDESVYFQLVITFVISKDIAIGYQTFSIRKIILVKELACENVVRVIFH